MGITLDNGLVVASLITNTTTISGSVSGLNITDYGAVGDGVTDDSAAFVAALGAIPDAVALGNSRNRNMRTIYIPEPDVAYHFTSEVTIPDTKQVRFVGEGSNGSRITSTQDYAFFLEAPGQFRSRSFENILFDGCGIRIDDQSRNQHLFSRLFFKDTPAYAIKIQSAGEVLGASGGVVGGRIADCEFENCAGAILCQGDQSDNWLVERCQFTRQTSADIKIYSAGWHITHNAFEQRWDANLDQPYINIAGSSVSDVIITHNRFGNEVGGLGTQPPKEFIVLGTLGASEAGVMLDIRIFSNYFRGRAATGPTTNSANVAIRFNVGVSHCQIKNNYFFKYNTALLQFAHANNNDGESNIFETTAEHSGVSGSTAHTPFFDPRPSHGQLGSWVLRGWEPEAAGAGRLAKEVTAIADSSQWTPTLTTVAQDVTSHDGRANAAYTITKTSSGSASIKTTLDTLDGQPVVASARFRYSTGSDVELARFYAQNTSSGTFTASTGQTFKLKPYWERQWFVFWPSAGDQVILWVGVEEVSSSLTGDMELDDVRVEYGTYPSTGGPNLTTYNTAAPVAGSYLQGDIVWNTGPSAAGNIGWVCTTSGSPGIWKTWGDIAA